MVSKKVVVAEAFGLHLRPAGKLCDISLNYQSKIQIRKDAGLMNAKSVLGVLAARVQHGDEVEIICDGPDENEALEALIKVLRDGFVD